VVAVVPRGCCVGGDDADTQTPGKLTCGRARKENAQENNARGRRRVSAADPVPSLSVVSPFPCALQNGPRDDELQIAVSVQDIVINLRMRPEGGLSTVLLAALGGTGYGKGRGTVSVALVIEIDRDRPACSACSGGTDRHSWGGGWLVGLGTQRARPSQEHAERICR